MVKPYQENVAVVIRNFLEITGTVYISRSKRAEQKTKNRGKW